MFNITISNVPGPDKPLYFRGAELLSIYPASIITHGQALNITCESYAGQMNFGFTACHTSVPNTQKLAVHAADALAELEATFLAPPPKRRTAAKKASTTKKTPAGKQAPAAKASPVAKAPARARRTQATAPDAS
jgi:hypothetical protein